VPKNPYAHLGYDAETTQSLNQAIQAVAKVARQQTRFANLLKAGRFTDPVLAIDLFLRVNREDITIEALLAAAGFADGFGDDKVRVSGIRDGKIVVNGVTRTGVLPDLDAAIVGYMNDHPIADAEAIEKEIRFTGTDQHLRVIVNRCRDWLRQAGVEWTISTRHPKGTSRWLERTYLKKSGH
jgi:hypothetical protein